MANEVRQFIDKHREALVNYLVQNMMNEDEQYTLSEYMLMHRHQMVLSSLYALGHPYAGLSRQQLIQFVNSCYDELIGLYGAYPGADGQLLTTFHCFQILLQLDAFNEVLPQSKANSLYEVVLHLISTDGLVRNSPGPLAEFDTKMSFAASFVLLMLQKFYGKEFDSDLRMRLINGIFKCYSNGQFSAVPGGELHQGNTFCCISALKLLEYDFPNDFRREIIFNTVKLQKICGGFAGRPEKDPDSCYSQWSCQTLRILKYDDQNLYNKQAIFDLQCLVYTEDNCSGFSDFPGNQPDLWHTHYVLSFLSGVEGSGLKKVSPVLNVDDEIVKKFLQ